MEIIEITSENIDLYLNRCLEIQAYLVSDPTKIDPSFFRKTATDDHTYFIGVVIEGKLMGLGVVCLQIRPVDVTGYIDNIVVHPNARGQGLFTVVMDELERYASAVWDCTVLTLTCSRPLVQGMYEKRGYIERETKYYRLQK